MTPGTEGAGGRARDALTSVVEAYFEAVRRRDADAIAALFAPDAQLVTAGAAFTGREAIHAFYRDLALQADHLAPKPGPMMVDGNRVSLEIELDMGTRSARVADFFTIEDGRIARMVVYMGLDIEQQAAAAPAS